MLSAGIPWPSVPEEPTPVAATQGRTRRRSPSRSRSRGDRSPSRSLASRDRRKGTAGDAVVAASKGGKPAAPAKAASAAARAPASFKPQVDFLSSDEDEDEDEDEDDSEDEDEDEGKVDRNALRKLVEALARGSSRRTQKAAGAALDALMKGKRSTEKPAKASESKKTPVRSKRKRQAEDDSDDE